MRKIIFITILIFWITGSLSVFAHGVEEEEKGKVIFDKLEAEELNCEDLSDDDFEALGEYFMGQMAGDAHPTMNRMMEQMMSKEGEEKMHIIMGKRMSGCDPNAQMPQNMMGMMPMMQMTGRGINSMIGNMMGWNSWGVGTGWAWLGWILMILFWILIILGIVVLIKWLTNQLSGAKKEKSALEILRKRYARGEISKEEFEEKKKDLTQ